MRRALSLSIMHMHATKSTFECCVWVLREPQNIKHTENEQLLVSLMVLNKLRNEKNSLFVNHASAFYKINFCMKCVIITGAMKYQTYRKWASISVSDGVKQSEKWEELSLCQSYICIPQNSLLNAMCDSYSQNLN